MLCGRYLNFVIVWLHWNTLLGIQVQILISFYQQDTLGLIADTAIDEESNFLFSGGDSLKALRLCEDILTAAGVTSPELLEVILDGTFSDVLHHVARVMQIQPVGINSTSLSEAKKRQYYSPTDVPAKKEHIDFTAAERLQAEKRSVRVIRRGEVIGMNIRNTDNNKNVQGDWLRERDMSEEDNLCLSLSWSSDTGRCVDASPVLLVCDSSSQRSDVTRSTVFIGSHSHRIQALDLITGSLLWERVLGDRIEASATLSHCGTLVVVGQCHLFEYISLKYFCCFRLLFLLDYFWALFFLQVVMMAVCISSAPNLEKHSGSLRREMLWRAVLLWILSVDLW